MHKHTINSYVKDAKIVDAVIVRNFPDLSIREPAPDQLSVPPGRFVEASVFAILHIHGDTGGTTAISHGRKGSRTDVSCPDWHS